MMEGWAKLDKEIQEMKADLILLENDLLLFIVQCREELNKEYL